MNAAPRMSGHLSSAEPPALLPILARTHAEVLATGGAPHRALIIGPAGSGKSRLLRRLRQRIAAGGTAVVRLTSAVDVPGLPQSDVLLVDDAHLLDPVLLAAVADRAADVDAGLLVACRPLLPGAPAEAATRILEQSQPALVLGHVSRADVAAHLEERGTSLTTACLRDILSTTGGAAWLVAEALAVHDGERCDDPRHPETADALQDVVAHRLRSSTAAVRAFVEAVCLASEGEPAPDAEPALVLAAYAEGFLLSNGSPMPLVRDAVLSTLSVERLIRAFTDDATADASLRLPAGVRDPRLAAALLHRGDEMLTTDPGRARELYRSAQESGADETVVAVRVASAAWALGAIDAAGTALDSVDVPEGHADRDAAIDLSASIWAARGLLPMSDQVYRSAVPRSPLTSAHASVAAIAVADRERGLRHATAAPGRTIPSTLSVATDLLSRGLAQSLTGSGQSALHDLVRASEMYSASGASGPTPELPAVLAALAALNLGEPEVAHSVLESAVNAGHGGAWAQRRLLLWKAWVALQQERAGDVESTLAGILPDARSLAPRERLLLDALTVAIARRYHDAAALTTAWRGARESLLRAQFDLYSILPLGEFVVTAVRVGEIDRVQPHFTEALASMSRLGSPPLWSAHLHWAGVQRAILLDSPAQLRPHARALVEAAAHNRLAATMAQAGRVWTSVLAGTVDADAVEDAALGLSAVGLAWDGARLAGHGAGLTDERRTISRLLAVARRLHPHEEVRPTAMEEAPASPSKPRSHSELSARELEVAALVVQGKTYAEIGTAIFISPRTAEHHIARIRRRLGATNRSDLIAKLRVALDESADDGGAQNRASA